MSTRISLPGPGQTPQLLGDAPRGDPSKVTAAATERFIEALVALGSISGAARASGLSVCACREW